ncbi:UDP-glucose 4-epimerase [Candidatus Uhrbacteria bacterium CG_4_9_14_3_um_filter_41_35]|uniref:UDP-glucose 4-epimerase n=1 Tax=Candidatus Uhrbacteria bacterium CG_4_9_14_3_um_filter_41_35 TaxID=1975034 RepID=A0A2M7XG97_9BACT|nr:MAG: UDP-glucose 4-epimerase [Candidatus Uhrbacteria bacterium CG_4_9_14_3_um_filter_41_35]
MKIIVTGGAGFIGSNLVDELIFAGHSVVVVDHYERSKTRFENPKAKIYKIKFADIEMASVFEKEKPDAICHLAAQISVTESVKNPQKDAQNNIVDSIAMLEMAKKAGIKKIIFSSSGGGIYGDHPEIPTGIDLNANPLSPYGIGKQSFEYYLAGSGIPYVALRLANVYGPRQMSEGEAGVISIFIEKILKSEPAKIFGDGLATRDYVSVGDVCKAFVRALTTDYTGILNIGTGVETSVKELWQMVTDISGQETSVIYEAGRDGEVQRSVIDATLAKEILNWQPEVELTTGLKLTYDWFKKLNRGV